MVRLAVSLHIPGSFVPFNYNYLLASALYRKFEEQGLSVHGSPLCYTFSRLLLRDRERVEGGFRSSWATLVFSTPSTEVLTLLAEVVLFSSFFQLGDAVLYVTDVRVEEGLKTREFKTLSPVTVYRSRRGRKTFFSPDDGEFYEVIEEHLRERFRSHYGRDPEGDFRLVVEDWKETVVVVKNTPYVSYELVGRVEGGELRDFALEAGLGKKTHFGFGCLGARFR